jgi:thiol-disulfide isomerase/thioredoxin
MLKLLKFSSPGCQPCIALARYLPEVIKETGVELVSYNLDDHESIFDKYNIRAAPTLIFLKDNVEILRKVGIVPKQTLIELINVNK